MRKTTEIIVTVLVGLTPILLLDAIIFVHPMDPTLWRGTHNFLGRWISWPHLRMAELTLGGLGALTFTVLLIGSAIGKWKNRKETTHTGEPPSGPDLMISPCVVISKERIYIVEGGRVTESAPTEEVLK